MIYGFTDCVIDADRRQLTRGGVEVPIEPQVFDLLLLLVENPNRVVTRDEVIEGVWGGGVVSESAISGLGAGTRAN